MRGVGRGRSGSARFGSVRLGSARFAQPHHSHTAKNFGACHHATLAAVSAHRKRQIEIPPAAIVPHFVFVNAGWMESLGREEALSALLAGTSIK